MYHMKAMHVLQSVCSFGQLNCLAPFAQARDKPMTYKLDTINSFVFLYELIDIALIHPFRYH